MKKINLLTVLAGILLCGGAARAQTTISTWNFENTTLSSTPSTTSGLIPADSGPGEAVGVHAVASTFATPTGNGSAKAFNSLHWTVGDYYQFTVPTTGYDDILVTFNQVSGASGPADFKLAYSTDGTDFTDFTSYTVLPNTTPNTWRPGIAVISTSYSEDLSAIPAVSDAPEVFLRLIDTSTTAAGGGTVSPSDGSRIDNFSVSGDAVSVPEPAANGWLLVGLVLGSLGARRLIAVGHRRR